MLLHQTASLVVNFSRAEVVNFSRAPKDDAVSAFRRMLRMNPGRAESYSLLGHALLQKGEKEYAREMFDAALKTDPEEDQAYLGLGAYNATNGTVWKRSRITR